jgi:hypothetical protein
MGKMKKVIAIAVAVTSLMAYQAANAAVVINVTAGDLTSTAGSPGTLIPDDALAILVADTTGTASPTNLDPSSSLAVGSNLTLTGGGDTYQILAVWNSGLGSGQQGLLSDTTGNIAGTTAGNELYLLWFPTLTLATTTAGSGTHYGEYGGTTESAGEIVGNGSAAWVMPSPGANVSLVATTPSEGGVSPYSELQATLTTVPEPSSIALVLIGLFGAVGLVRRRS